MQILAFFDSIITTSLLQITQVTGSVGLAIIFLTILIRLALLPISLPAMRAQYGNQEKMKLVQAEMKKLKKKYAKNPQKLNAEQMKLYQKYNLNPLRGCLPMIIQLIMFGLLYHGLFTFFRTQTAFEPNFLWFDLTTPDSWYILPFLAAASQLVLSVMILPGGEVRDLVPNTSKSKKVKKENEQEEDTAEMAAAMQKQMMILMPAMTGILATQFPSGLALYWIVTTIWSIGQQYYVSGWGGLQTYWQRAQNYFTTQTKN